MSRESGIVSESPYVWMGVGNEENRGDGEKGKRERVRCVYMYIWLICTGK